MTKEDIKYQAYIQILKEELIPAMGCTEPNALAYAAAKAREVLGCIPERVHIGASGSTTTGGSTDNGASGSSTGSGSSGSSDTVKSAASGVSAN